MSTSRILTTILIITVDELIAIIVGPIVAVLFPRTEAFGDHTTAVGSLNALAWLGSRIHILALRTGLSATVVTLAISKITVVSGTCLPTPDHLPSSKAT
tara:strand:- start:142 stop:438 length:297 start_codon:yes stop_codon:yes gene_type:complete